MLSFVWEEEGERRRKIHCTLIEAYYSTDQFYFYLIETSSLENEKNAEDQECSEVPDLDQLYKLTQEEQDLILEDWNEGNIA